MLKTSAQKEALMTKDVLWRELYKAAILELDPAILHKRIEAAHAAIQQRTAELGNSHDGNPGEERREMVDALNNLRAIQKVESRVASESSGPGRRPISEAS